MRIKLSKQEFIEKLIKHSIIKRSKVNFSIAGMEELYGYITGYEERSETEIDFDAEFLNCNFTEYSSLEHFNSVNPIKFKNITQIGYHTVLIRIDQHRFIISNF